MEIRMASQIVEWERRIQIEEEKQTDRRNEKYLPVSVERKISQEIIWAGFARIIEAIVKNVAVLHPSKPA